METSASGQIFNRDQTDKITTAHSRPISGNTYPVIDGNGCFGGYLNIAVLLDLDYVKRESGTLRTSLSLCLTRCPDSPHDANENIRAGDFSLLSTDVILHATAIPSLPKMVNCVRPSRPDVPMSDDCAKSENQSDRLKLTSVYSVFGVTLHSPRCCSMNSGMPCYRMSFLIDFNCTAPVCVVLPSDRCRVLHWHVFRPPKEMSARAKNRFCQLFHLQDTTKWKGRYSYQF